MDIIYKQSKNKIIIGLMFGKVHGLTQGKMKSIN